jgi:hypothetical protein
MGAGISSTLRASRVGGRRSTGLLWLLILPPSQHVNKQQLTPATAASFHRALGLALQRDRPVIITVVSMWMMQVVVNQVVKVITVGNALMCTTGTVYMSLVMPTTVMTGCALIGIGRVDFQHVFVNVIHVHVMQVTIMQIIGVAGMSDSHVAAGESVLMAVPLMLGAGVHREPPISGRCLTKRTPIATSIQLLSAA